MADENITVVLGIPIPSTDPIFLGIVGVHIVFGLAAVITGAVAMLSQKGRGRHSNFGTNYFGSLSGVFVTMSALSFMRWAENYHLGRFHSRLLISAARRPNGAGANGPGCIFPASAIGATRPKGRGHEPSRDSGAFAGLHPRDD
jgi:hypothetical protein